MEAVKGKGLRRAFRGRKTIIKTAATARDHNPVMGSLQGAGGAGLGETEINQPVSERHSPEPVGGEGTGGGGPSTRRSPLRRTATCTFPPKSVPFGCEAWGHPALGIWKGGQGRADVGTSGPPSGITSSCPRRLDTRSQHRRGPLLGESVCLSPHQGPEPHRVGWGGGAGSMVQARRYSAK